MIDNFFCVWCYLRIWSIVRDLCVLADFLFENASLFAWINWVIATVLRAIYVFAGTFSSLILEFSCINLALELAWIIVNHLFWTCDESHGTHVSSAFVITACLISITLLFTFIPFVTLFIHINEIHSLDSFLALISTVVTFFKWLLFQTCLFTWIVWIISAEFVAVNVVVWALVKVNRCLTCILALFHIVVLLFSGEELHVFCSSFANKSAWIFILSSSLYFACLEAIITLIIATQLRAINKWITWAKSFTITFSNTSWHFYLMISLLIN